jgi:hypothetical protein
MGILTTDNDVPTSFDTAFAVELQLKCTAVEKT